MRIKLFGLSIGFLIASVSNTTPPEDNMLPEASSDNIIEFFSADNVIIPDDINLTDYYVVYDQNEVNTTMKSVNFVNDNVARTQVNNSSTTDHKITAYDMGTKSYYWADYNNAKYTVLGGESQFTGFMVHPTFKQRVCYYSNISHYHTSVNRSESVSVDVGFNLGIMGVSVSKASTTTIYGGVSIPVPAEIQKLRTTLYVDVEYEVREYEIKYYNAMTGKYAYTVYGNSTVTVGEDYRVESC